MKFNTYKGKTIEVTKKEIEFLYWEKKLSINQIAKKLDICVSVLQKRMVKEDISRRESKKRDLEKPSKNTLRKLYYKDKFTLEKIAGKLDVATSTVFRWMKEYDISTIKMKYKKYSFSGDLNEKAYILGMSYGDLHVCRHSKQIAVQLTTTHPSMIKLFYKMFEKYGTPKKYPKYNKTTERYEWALYVLLDKSFEFLLSTKLSDIEKEQFKYFLAGFFDSEGCLHIYNNHGFIGLTFLVYNNDKKIIDYILENLKKDNFKPKLRKMFKKGIKTTNNYYRGNDLWSISLHTNNEVKRILEVTPIQHEEKINKTKIASNIVPNKKWKNIVDEVTSLRNQIKEEVKTCTLEAANEWIKRQGEQNERSNVLQKTES